MPDIRTTCTRDCPDSCGIIATVEDGRIIRHRGDPEHGVTRGFLCARGNDYLKRFHAPDRVLHPLRRTATGWTRIGWDDALELVAGKLAQFRDESGPLSVLALSYSGIHSWVPRVRVLGDGSVRRDVLLFNPARWRGDLHGVNQLREALVTDLGDGAAMHDTRVRLQP